MCKNDKVWEKQLQKEMLTVKYCLADFFRQGGTPLTLSSTRTENGVKNGPKLKQILTTLFFLGEQTPAGKRAIYLVACRESIV